MSLLNPLTVQNFVNLQNSSHEDYMSSNIVWKRSKEYLQPFNEDYMEVVVTNDDGYDYISLPVLMNFNYERTWPISEDTEFGQTDRQTIQLIFSKDQLGKLGYINDNGNFDYNPGTDKFIIKGIIYHQEGDTPAGQIPDLGGELVFMVIVRPDLKATNESPR